MVVNLQQSKNRANPGEIPSGGEGVPFLRLSCHERGRARLCRRRSGAPRPPCPKMSGTISKTTIPICRTFRTISAFPRCPGFRARFPLVLAERRVPGRGVGTPGRAAQMPVAEGFPLMLRVLTDPGFRADPDKLAGVLAEWSAWDIRATFWARHCWKATKTCGNGRRAPPSGSAPRGFPPSVVSPQQHAHSFPSGCCSPPCGTTSPCLGKSGKPRPLWPICATSGPLGRERWRKAGRHLCAAAWLEEQTPTDKLLEKAVDDWNSPTDMQTHHSSLERRRPHRAQGPLAETGRHPLLGGPTDRGGPGRANPRLRRLDARPCGRSNRKTHDPHDAGVRGEPDVPDENGMFPEEAARRSGASAELLKLLAAPPPEWTQGTDGAPQRDKQAPPRPDPGLGVSTAAQRGKPDDTKKRNGSVSGKNRIRNRFVSERLRENTAQRGGETVSAERAAHAEIRQPPRTPFYSLMPRTASSVLANPLRYGRRKPSPLQRRTEPRRYSARAWRGRNGSISVSEFPHPQSCGAARRRRTPCIHGGKAVDRHGHAPAAQDGFQLGGEGFHAGLKRA